jgi:hypothetical protein
VDRNIYARNRMGETKLDLTGSGRGKWQACANTEMNLPFIRSVENFSNS